MEDLSTSTMSSSQPPRKTVAFQTEPSVKYIEKRHRPNMAKQIFEKFGGQEVTDAMLKEAAGLFNENYGIWGTDPTNPESMPRQGELHEDCSYHISNNEARKSREAEQKPSTSSISTRQRRLLLRKSHMWGSASR